MITNPWHDAHARARIGAGGVPIVAKAANVSMVKGTQKFLPNRRR
jgi:hypothetical protein